MKFVFRKHQLTSVQVPHFFSQVTLLVFGVLFVSLLSFLALLIS